MLELGGYETEVTKQSRDYGVDVIAIKEDYKIVIQVKKYSNPLSIKCVQEIIAGKDYFDADERWVMSTAPKFTRQAKEQADISNIKLFNYNDLALFLSEIQESNINADI